MMFATVCHNVNESIHLCYFSLNGPTKTADTYPCNTRALIKRCDVAFFTLYEEKESEMFPETKPGRAYSQITYVAFV